MKSEEFPQKNKREKKKYKLNVCKQVYLIPLNIIKKSEFVKLRVLLFRKQFVKAIKHTEKWHLN